MSTAAAPLVMITNTDQVFVALLQELLEDEGYAAFSWLDGSSAYFAARQRQPACIVLDVNITNADAGLSTLDALTLDPATTGIPIILTTTNPGAFFESRAQLEARGIQVLVKPFDIDILVAQLRAALGQPPRAS